jgi:hypothetical protein
MGKEGMALQSFNHGDHSIMAADPKVVSLGDVMGQDDAGCGSDSRKHGQQDSTF